MKDSAITSKEKAIRSRISKAKAVEEFIGFSYDSIIHDDKKVYAALIKIKDGMNDSHGNFSNTLRKYYQNMHGKPFKQLKTFERDNLKNI